MNDAMHQSNLQHTIKGQYTMDHETATIATALGLCWKLLSSVHIPNSTQK